MRKTQAFNVEKNLKSLFHDDEITKSRVFTSCSNVQPTRFTLNAYVILIIIPGEHNLTFILKRL